MNYLSYLIKNQYVIWLSYNYLVCVTVCISLMVVVHSSTVFFFLFLKQFPSLQSLINNGFCLLKSQTSTIYHFVLVLVAEEEKIRENYGK